MDHIYDDAFYTYIERGAFASARVIVPFVKAWLAPASVADFGCGRGAWLNVWREAGVTDCVGVDGDYVARERLHIPPAQFFEADLNAPIDVGRRFDLVTSFEVAEHLRPAASETFVDSLTRHADKVLFSAAIPGQGGEHHINERPLEAWRAAFAARGFKAFDCVRPNLAGAQAVEPWYRYNMVLYANAAGRKTLSEFVTGYATPADTPLADVTDWAWKARTLLVRPLPRRVVDWIAITKARRQAKDPAP